MNGGRRLGTTGLMVVALMVVALLGLGACTDDEAEVVSQEQYDEEAIRLCNRHGAELDTTFSETSFVELSTQARSDAERVSFIRAEFTPRGRAIVRELNAFGTPADKRGQYVDAYNRAIGALQEIESDTYVLMDRAGRGDLPKDEDPFTDLGLAFADADIPC